MDEREKARPYAHPAWDCCTAEGSRRKVLELGLETGFHEKLQSLEAAGEAILRARASRDEKPSPPQNGRPHHTMIRRLDISASALDEAALLRERSLSRGMGAVVYFLGVVRDTEEGAPISAIDYEAFQEMARHQFERLFDEMERRWPIDSVRLIHRIGVVPVNQPSLWVEVIAPHRGEAFAACQWLIDEMKRVVPIWKRPVAGAAGAAGG